MGHGKHAMRSGVTVTVAADVRDSNSCAKSPRFVGGGRGAESGVTHLICRHGAVAFGLATAGVAA
eukprot:2331717-Alexandrium_andersonii.AAC.1